MERKAVFYAVFIILLVGQLHADYCKDLFTNSMGIVTNSFALSGGTGAPQAIYQNMLAISFLVILMVLAVLSMVYAIGIGFRIEKLIIFTKSEYLQSFFNLVIVLILYSSMALIGNAASFFSAVSNVGLSGTAAIPSGSGIGGVYTGICENIAQYDIAPAASLIIGTLSNQLFLNMLSSVKISITPLALDGLIPSFSFNPFAATGLISSLTFTQMALFSGFISLGLGMIFLFFTIYFLFPLFLYMGILLRSFPWTRAAGGTFIALFISFYIILPVLFYPFTTFKLAAVTCSSMPSSICTNYEHGFWYSILTGFWHNLKNMLDLVFFNPGNTLIAIMEMYVENLAFISIGLVGFGIAFIISFDMLEMLGDFLGAPSLTRQGLLEKVI